MGINDLVNNISDSVQSLGGLVGLGSSKSKFYQSFPGLTTDEDTVRANWNSHGSYSFAVVSLGSKLGSTVGSFGQFDLPLNPTELNQDENFAISIRPTQGGTVTNHGGNRYKDLVIQGTTGIAPFRGAGGVEKSTGKAIFQPNQLKYKSGFEVFTILRNWFKSYYEWKNTDQTPTARNAKLIFRNFKDGETLIVELLKFSLKRSAGRKYLYDYTLTFKVLGHFVNQSNPSALNLLQKIDAFVSEAKEKIDDARGVFLQAQNILRQVEATYDNTILEPLRKIALAIKAFQGIGTVAADMGKAIISNTLTDVAALGVLLRITQSPNVVGTNLALVQKALDRANNNSRGGVAQAKSTNTALVASLMDKSNVLMQVDSTIMPAASQAALAQQMAEAKTLPRSFYSDALTNLKRVRDNLADSLNLNSPTYDKLSGRTPTFVPDLTKTATDDEITVLAAFGTAIKGLEKVLASNSMFTSTFASRISDIETNFADPLPLQVEQAVREFPLPQNTDLEHLAATYLGDSSRWPEIAEVNDLKPPYIIQDQSDTTPNVLHPGESILIPSPLVNGFGTTPQGKPTYFTESLSQVEKNLGVDFLVTPTFDLQLTNQGDLELAIGAQNAAQAIVLKLMYEPGDLIKHPEIGVGLEPGNKFPSLTDIKSTLIRTLTQDPRFESVSDIGILRKSGTLYLSFRLKVKSVDIPVPVSVKL